MVLLFKTYHPSHPENRMSHEGDVTAARTRFLDNKNKNVRYLLERRYQWMNSFIDNSDEGIEVGAGAGVSRSFIRGARRYQLTDFSKHNWLDVKDVDALNVPFADADFDFVVTSNMIHHVPYPMQFFEEMARILKPGGRLIIQEIHASLLTRLALRLMRHEGYDSKVNVFERDSICTDPDDLWSVNCYIPRLLFDDFKKFHRKVSDFRCIHHSYSECLLFLNSGGVIAQTKYVPLPKWGLVFIDRLDRLLVRLLPNVFAMQRQIVLEKT